MATTQNSAHCLTYKQSKALSSVFVQTAKFVYSNIGLSSKETVLRFLTTTATSEKPYMLVTTEGVSRAVGIVFTDEVIRDYILTLHSVFLARWSHNADMYNALLLNLASGTGIGGAKKDTMCALPDIINDRLATVDDAYAVLKDNSWLVILLLICMHLTVETISSYTSMRNSISSEL